MNPRQPGLSCALFLYRQALTRSTFGISALHKRNASPVHACRPSGVYRRMSGAAQTEQPTIDESLPLLNGRSPWADSIFISVRVTN
jgi:hypothetical protein